MKATKGKEFSAIINGNLEALALAIGKHVLREALVEGGTTVSVKGRKVRTTTTVKTKRKLSAKGREAIRKAVKARWKKYHAAQKAKATKAKAKV
jgi:hypothetical protein